MALYRLSGDYGILLWDNGNSNRALTAPTCCNRLHRQSLGHSPVFSTPRAFAAFRSRLIFHHGGGTGIIYSEIFQNTTGFLILDNLENGRSYITALLHHDAVYLLHQQGG